MSKLFDSYRNSVMGERGYVLLITTIILFFIWNGCYSKKMPSDYSNIYEHNITQLYSDSLPNEGEIWKARRNAFNELFKTGKDAIPTLLKYGLDTRVVKFIIVHPNCSVIPIGEEQNLRIGIICLYLIEAIKTQEQYHSTPRIFYAEWQGNEDQIQNRAYTAYLKWWKSVKEQELTKDYTRIVPWVGYLGYVVKSEDIKDNIDFK